MKFLIVFVLFLLFTYTYSDICRKLNCVECIEKSDCVYGENLNGYKCEQKGNKNKLFYTLSSCKLNSVTIFFNEFIASSFLLNY